MRPAAARVSTPWRPLSLSFAFALLCFLGGQLRPAGATGRGDTWSIVAVDPESGEVGVAAASCVPQPIDAVAALVPGQGAAATQADFSLRNRNQVYALLQEGRPAGAIVAVVTAPSFDPRAAVRQYGVVTLAGGGEVAAYTGAETFAWAGHSQAEAANVTVQGNLLEGEAVVAEALAAYLDADGPLSDRLLQALVAGSEAGGDRRCNRPGARQTAAAAFIMVARAGDPPFAAPALGVSAVGEPDTPWLYLSVSEPLGGENAVALLQAAYASWREQALSTEDATLPATAAERPARTLFWGLLAALVILALLLSLRLLARGRQR